MTSFYYVKPAHGLLTSLFSNARPNPVLQGVIRPHQGIDIGGDTDNTIIAAAGGVVRFVETNAKRTGFGLYVVITHPNGQETLYAHLAAISVRVGQHVKQAQKIGVKGSTGNSTGTHLHFEISRGRWTNDFANKLDPLLQFYDPVTAEIQRMLSALGYAVSTDGVYGDATIAAVTRYQRAKRFKTVDGVAGRATYAALEADAKALPGASIAKDDESKPKEADYLAELLPTTQQADMRKLLKRAYDEKVFAKDHTAKVSTMTRGEALDLLISYLARAK